MPFTVERREPGVYFLAWEGAITRDELLKFIEVRIALGKQHGDTNYVLIIDLSNATMREFDIRTSRNAIEDPDLLAIFVINPSVIIQTLINMLRQLTRKPIEICANYEEAIQKAHEALSR